MTHELDVFEQIVLHPESTRTEYRDSSMYHTPANPTQYDENEECKTEGRKRAKIKIFENLYKQFYLQTGINDFHLNFQEQIDQNNCDIRRNYLFLTLNPDPIKIRGQQNLRSFTEYCDDIQYRSWIKKKISSNYEYRNYETKQGLHYHALYELKVLYSPAQISSVLFRGKGSRYFGNKKHIYAKKSDIRTTEYIEKNEKITSSDILRCHTEETIEDRIAVDPTVEDVPVPPPMPKSVLKSIET